MTVFWRFTRLQVLRTSSPLSSFDGPEMTPETVPPRPSRWPIRSVLVHVLLVCALVLLACQIGRLSEGYAYGSPGTKDLIEYWTAGKLLRAGEDPYDSDRLYELQRQAGSTF